MNYLVKNESKESGIYLLNNKWYSLLSGDSKSLPEKPRSISSNLKVVSIPDIKNITNTKKKNSRKKDSDEPSGDSGLCFDDNNSVNTVIEEK